MKLKPVPQQDDQATYAPNLNREDERVDWSKSARAIFNQVRGLSPMAGAFTYLNGEVFKIWACAVPSEADQRQSDTLFQERLSRLTTVALQFRQALDYLC